MRLPLLQIGARQGSKNPVGRVFGRQGGDSRPGAIWDAVAAVPAVKQCRRNGVFVFDTVQMEPDGRPSRLRAPRTRQWPFDLQATKGHVHCSGAGFSALAA
jgi:hypothetical protein